MRKSELETLVKKLQGRVAFLEAGIKAANQQFINYDGKQFIAVPMEHREMEAMKDQIEDSLQRQWCDERSGWFTVDGYKVEHPTYAHFRVWVDYTKENGIMMGEVWGMVPVVVGTPTPAPIFTGDM